jgi:hypothetical protein
MDVKKASKFIADRIEELEKATFTFEEVLQPRYAADKKILERLRDQHLKLEALLRKVEAGEEVVQQDIYDCVPSSFR